MRAVVLMLLLASLVPLVGAQSSPAVDNATFYGQVDCDSSTYGLSTVKQSTGTNCGTGTPATSMAWTLPEARAADSTLTFADGGEVQMTIWIGSGTHAGNVDVTGTITAGETVVAQASGSVTFVGAVGGYEELVLTTTVQVAEATGPLTWTIEADGGFSSIFLRFEEGRWTQFTLPITAVSGGPSDGDPVPAEFESLEAPPVLNLSFEQPTTKILVYNWTMAADATASWNVTGNGSVSAVLSDGNGTVLLNETLDGMASANLSGANGTWGLRLHLDDFQGTLAFDVLDALQIDPEPTPDGNQTAPNGTDDPDAGAVDEESPGLGILAVAAVAVVAWIRRR